MVCLPRVIALAAASQGAASAAVTMVVAVAVAVVATAPIAFRQLPAGQVAEKPMRRSPHAWMGRPRFEIQLLEGGQKLVDLLTNVWNAKHCATCRFANVLWTLGNFRRSKRCIEGPSFGFTYVPGTLRDV